MNVAELPRDPSVAVASLRRRYLVALASIALLATIGQSVLQWTFWKQTHDAQVVNIAGRQRMLSQRLAKSALGVALAPNDAERRASFSELGTTLREWRDAHHALKHREVRQELAGRNSTEIVELLESLEEPFEHMSAAAAKILDDSRFSATATDPRLAQSIAVITNEEDAFLAKMEPIVRQYAHEANARVESVRVIELVLFVITLLGVCPDTGFPGRY